MTEEEQQQTAAQLRKPHGEDGIKFAEMMNQGNLQINNDTLVALDAQAGDKILEIGMGNGYFVKDILSKDESITYVGSDYSELMVKESVRINSEWISKGQAKFIFCDVASLPFADNSFNKIFNVNTIYFWDDEIKVLHEIRRVLSPNGKLIIGFRPKHYAAKYPFLKYGFKQFSKEDLTELLSAHGFMVTAAIENREPDFEMNGEVVEKGNIVVVATKK